MITQNDSNVYIIGAGLSAERGLPVMSNFLDYMRDSQLWLRDQDRTDEYHATMAVLSFRLKSSAAGYRIRLDLDNIEDLFSLASATGDVELQRCICKAIAATLEYSEAIGPDKHVTLCRSSDARVSSEWKRNGAVSAGVIGYDVPFFHLVADVLGGAVCSRGSQRCDTAITFNYDTLLERAAVELGLRVDYGLGDRGVIYREQAPWQRPVGEPGSGTEPGADLRVLKLHGSVNWGVNLAGELVVADHYRTVREQGLIPSIVPPTWRKLATGPLEATWGRAVRAVRDATRIVFIGFSLPSTDLYIKYLLAAGLRENISLRKILIVDRSSAAVYERACGVFDERLVQRGQLTQLSTPASQFMLSPSTLAEIGRPVGPDFKYTVQFGTYTPDAAGAFPSRFRT